MFIIIYFYFCHRGYGKAASLYERVYKFHKRILIFFFNLLHVSRMQHKKALELQPSEPLET